MTTQTTEITYGPAMTDAEQAGYARVLAHSFGRTEKEAMEWIVRYPREVTRVLKRGDTVLAGLILIRMGQFFGGRSVPMTGISAVGAAPEARGRGVALDMMKRCVVEMHQDGVPISGLYPATQRLYRLAGWEQSGHRCEVRIPLSSIGIRENTLEIRPMEETDRPRVYELYREQAQHRDGHLDRVPVMWDRVERPPPSRVDPARTFVVMGESGDIEGYVYLTQPTPPVTVRGKHELALHDMQATTPRAARRLWSFLSSYATMATELAWFTGPSNPLLTMLSEQPYRLSLHFHWMTRIVDVAAALRARGYAPGLRLTLGLDVSDDLVSANSGSYVLEIGDGVGRVTKGNLVAGPRITTTINGLAALYANYLPAHALKLAGMLDGDDDSLRAATAAFTGGTPWMPDMY